MGGSGLVNDAQSELRNALCIPKADAVVDEWRP
jgi:hypothetical protein